MVFLVIKIEIEDKIKTVQIWEKRKDKLSSLREKYPIVAMWRAQKIAQIKVKKSPKFIEFNSPPKRRYRPIITTIIAIYVLKIIFLFVKRKLKKGVIGIEIDVIKALFVGEVYLSPIVWKRYAEKRKVPAIKPLIKISLFILILNM